MTKIAVEHVFTGDTVAYTSYDSTKTNLGKLIVQKTGATPEEKWAGPLPIAFARVGENALGVAAGMAHAISWSTTYDMVFLFDQSAAATTRRVLLYTYNKLTADLSFKGSVLLTMAAAGNHTIAHGKAIIYTYSTGTVAVSGTAVTGTTTAWQTARFAAGARIGFGSTNPTAITTWYYIATITDDTNITLSTTAGTIAGGTAFVIEEVRLAMAATSSTAASGGIVLTKGLNLDTFSIGGTTIAAAVSTDNVQAVYLLKDGVGNTNAMDGIAFEPPASNTSHVAYVVSGATTTATITKWNLRAALTVSTGQSSSAYTLTTNGLSVSGNLSTACNLVFANTLNQTNGSGVDSVYFTTVGFVYRVPTSDITASSNMPNAFNYNPVPAAHTTFSVATVYSNLCYVEDIQRFTIGNNNTSNLTRQYVVVYGDQGTSFFSINGLQQNNRIASSLIYPYPQSVGAQTFLFVLGGILYWTSNSTTTSYLHAIPLGAHWDFAAGIDSARQNRLITPKLATTGASKLLRAYVSNTENLGGDNLGIGPEAYRVYTRTSGIDDDSGGWTLLDRNFDLTDITPSTHIQLMFEFRVAGLTCVPARIYSCAVVYEDSSTNSHYQPSADLSDLTNKEFAWKFFIPFHADVPQLRVRLYNAETDVLLIDDTTEADMLDDLIAYWKFDELAYSTPYAFNEVVIMDSHGSNHLRLYLSDTVSNASDTLYTVDGKIGKCLNYTHVYDHTMVYGETDLTELNVGDIDFTVQAWIKFTSVAATQKIIFKDNGTLLEYKVLYDSSTSRITFSVSNDGTATTTVSANNFGAPSTGVWYLVHCWHDAANNQIGIAINGGTADTTSHTTGVYAGTGYFLLGGDTVASTQFFEGLIDEVAFWKRVLTSQDRTDLYNSGNALAYPFTPNPLFEKSTNGGSSWTVYDYIDKINEETYIRYTASGLDDDIPVRAWLTTE